MSRGKRRLVYCSDARLEAQGGNPRCGSDVYLDGIQYSIERVEVELSRVPGAPTMPVTQWRRYLSPSISDPERAMMNAYYSSTHD